MCEKATAQIGSLILTPTERPGVVVKILYGARGDVTRALIRYLDSTNAEDEVRLPLGAFRILGHLSTARKILLKETNLSYEK